MIWLLNRLQFRESDIQRIKYSEIFRDIQMNKYKETKILVKRPLAKDTRLG